MDVSSINLLVWSLYTSQSLISCAGLSSQTNLLVADLYINQYVLSQNAKVPVNPLFESGMSTSQGQ